MFDLPFQLFLTTHFDKSGRHFTSCHDVVKIMVILWVIGDVASIGKDRCTPAREI